jgi:1,2-diacylglycerol 3-beta-glucosyltransferase
MAMAQCRQVATMATTVIGSLIGILVALCGVPTAACCLYLLVLAVAGAGYHAPIARLRPRSRLMVIVPAHNEVGMIGECVRSLRAQRYPQELYQVVVVADNCSDATAAVAEAAGAEILVRHVSDLRGKGHALRWAIERVLGTPTPPDAVVVVDADSVADPDFLRELEAVFVEGHRVVQADDVLRTEPGRPGALLEAAALLLRNRVRFMGRGRFGLPASLCGNGMLLATTVLSAHPWHAFSVTEDAEYALSLLTAGVPTTFAPRARVIAAPTEGGHGAYTQSLRWDGGRLALTRAWMLPLLLSGLRRRDPRTLSMVLDLAVPPLGVLVLTTVAGTSVSVALWLASVTAGWTVAPWLLAMVALPAYLVVGLASCRVPAATYLAFLLAPVFLARKVRVYAHLLFGLEGQSWIRTQRPADARSGQGDSDTP